MLLEHQAKANREARIAEAKRHQAAIRRKAKRLVKQVLAVWPAPEGAVLKASGQSIIMRMAGDQAHHLWAGASDAQRVLAHWQGYLRGGC